MYCVIDNSMHGIFLIGLAFFEGRNVVIATL